MSTIIRIILICLLNFLYFVSCELNLPDGSPCVSEGLNGTCVSVYRCPIAAHTYIYTRAGYSAGTTPKFPEICSYNGKVPIVCCTDCEIHEDEFYKNYVVNVRAELIKKVGPKARDKCLDYLQEHPYPCHGHPRGLRIVFGKGLAASGKCYWMTVRGVAGEGGRAAERWEFPHMALHGFGAQQESAQWVCGGSIVSERFILTAAHCTYTRTLGYVTFAALGLLKRSDPLEYWNIFKIKRIIKHPEYKPPSKYHDIALLETEIKMQFNRGLLPACLDTGTDEESAPWADASGWGQLGHRNALADTLQVMSLKRFNETECSSLYPEHRHLRRGFDHTTQLCYGSHHRIVNTCQGDSGGPLQINEDQCLYTIVGLTSFGTDCGVLGSAGVYTRVSHYVPSRASCGQIKCYNDF